MATAPALSHIIDLLSRIDTAWLTEPNFGRDANWQPATPEVAAVIDELLLPENRDALAAWYGRYSKSEMNAAARSFCEYLERRSGTPLSRC